MELIVKKKLLLFKIKRLRKEILEMSGDIYSGSLWEQMKILGESIKISVKEGAKNIKVYYGYLLSKAKQQSSSFFKLVGNFIEKNKNELLTELSVIKNKVSKMFSNLTKASSNEIERIFSWFTFSYHSLISKAVDFKNYIIIKGLRTISGYESINKFDPRNIIIVMKQVSREAYIIYKSKGLFAALKYVLTKDAMELLAIVTSLILIIFLVYITYVALKYAYNHLSNKVSLKDVKDFSKKSRKTVNAISKTPDPETISITDIIFSFFGFLFKILEWMRMIYRTTILILVVIGLIFFH